MRGYIWSIQWIHVLGGDERALRTAAPLVVVAIAFFSSEGCAEQSSGMACEFSGEWRAKAWEGQAPPPVSHLHRWTRAAECFIHFLPFVVRVVF
jgi:hypothetical protein